jgi:cellobiose phosphorylase
MERHGRALAAAHRTSQGPSSGRLLLQLNRNEAQLNAAAAMLARMVRDEVRINPAGEWLLDNYYLVEEQVRMARRHLPDGYSRELPNLGSGASAGLPRVYDLASEAIAHGDGRIDAAVLSRFVAAYQTVTPLTLGELWAIPIMLRLALIDNLRRMAVQVMSDGEDHRLASGWVRRLNRTAASSPKDVVLVVADMARSDPPLSGAFVAELTRGLQGRGAVLSMPTAWIEQWIAEAGHSVEGLIHAESQRQAADQVSIGNSIGSLRFLDHMDWREFVETMSVVEHILLQDPAGIYAGMDFDTRDTYRHVVEQMSRRGGIDEARVAALILQLAQQPPARGITRHVGYYLVDDGRAQAQLLIGDEASVSAQRRKIRLPPLRTSMAWYLLPIVLLAACFSFGLLWPLHRIGQHHAALIGALALLALVVFSELGVTLVNWGVTLLIPPRALPRMDLAAGIPAHCRTLVVIPSLIGSLAEVDALVEALEVRFLANRDGHLHFALLTDFLDAPQETMPGDAEMVEHAVRHIEQLNARYSPEHGNRFFLLHRPRLWNAAERCWMGYERKRGKLAALNQLLRSDRHDDHSALGFQRVCGATSVLTNVRYVITLDSDTQLPRDVARELVASMAHPLNQPRMDEATRRIDRGYGILQPGIGTSMSGGQESRYARMFGSEPGIDPYTGTVSDVYQDLFGEGSFIGKGIYDVDAFELVLAGRFPDNRILSHDLLEGCYARAGLISDVQLFENYPARYLGDARRRSRWIRGDWQLLPWLLPWVPLADGGYERNPLSWLSRGKLLDNLRRSLVPTAAVTLFACGWLLSPTPVAWTLWLLTLWVAPVLLPAVHTALRKPVDSTLRIHLREVVANTWRQLLRAAVSVACLPYEAAFGLLAIARTLWRMTCSHRHLLQWNPSSEVERALRSGTHAEWRAMAIAPLVSLGLVAALCQLAPASLWAAGLLLLGWGLSPWLMAWLGQPPPSRGTWLAPAQLVFLGRLARRTWDFFATHHNEDDHWLPPDNIQEYPIAIVAHRTSPTNIGLSLLANLAAYDLGYLPAGEVVERTRRTLVTLESLPRHRGHFYNWYDTQTLQALPPRYVSTVDSGNLAGHLLTLRQGLLAMVDAPVIVSRLFDGLGDTLGVLQEAAADHAQLSELCERFGDQLANLRWQPARTLAQIDVALSGLCGKAEAILVAAENGGETLLRCAKSLADDCQAAQTELRHWLSNPVDIGTGTPAVHVAEEGVTVPTLRQLREHSDDASLRARASERIQQLERLAHLAGQFAQMEYGFLYDRARHLLAIGYNVDERRLDAGQYDLLASEVRLCNFVAIAQGQLPQESWFALGRLMTEIEGGAALLSWSGSMFEYLMPQLVMPSYPDTLLDRTAQQVVRAQIGYGSRHGVPWGVSESGYNAVDARLNYQYRAFGVPGLGLKRGLGQDLVVAPYASTMALMVAPVPACQNLQRLSEEGFGGRFGLYEAIDYTPARVPRGQEHVAVRSFMSHHQGMALLALDYLLCGQPMQQRFVADAQFQATLLLLQERVPRTGLFRPQQVEGVGSRSTAVDTETPLRIIRDPDRSRPGVQLLSNGRYHGMLSSAGGGYSRQRDMAVTRWREDSTRDHWGTFCYLRDVDTGEVWSATHQPTCVEVEGYEAIFSDAKAEFRGRHQGYDTHLEIAISAEDDVELRRLRISNSSRRRRVIEITTYAEVVLAPALADELHPAFGNLFVQSEILADKQALLCTRRARAHDEIAPWMFHLVAVHDADIDEISYETDRARFLGRGRNPGMPQALVTTEVLSGTAGSVLDPIVAIRCRIELAPEQRAQIDMVYGVGSDREACAGLVDKYRDRRLADRVFDLALTHSQVVRRQINASQADALLYERLAGLVLYTHSLLRADPELLAQNRRGQSGLWGHTISGDLPIVLLRVTDTDNIELVRQMVQAHAYWRLKGLRADLVIWNESQAGYRQQLQDQIVGMVSADPEANVLDRPGGIFVRAAEHISDEDRILLQTVARAIVSDRYGSLAAQLDRYPAMEYALPARLATERPRETTSLGNPDLAAGMPQVGADADALLAADPGQPLFGNGLGAFAADGREYLIDQGEGSTTPAPWANVIANAQFGSVLSESACGYSWLENAHEFRLTPWHNDPVSDSAGEAFYLRDEDTGAVWSPMALPCRGSGSYRTRHGFGYSVYEHVEDGIASELWVYVDLQQPIKYSLLRLRNLSGRARRLSATGYVQWVLGDIPARSRMHVVSEVDTSSGLVTARNPYNSDFEGRVAFFDVDADTRSFTTDRSEFLGRNGHLAAPAALLRERLSGRHGAGLDPCAALQVPIALATGQVFETVFRLGAERSGEQAAQLAEATRGSEHAHRALKEVRDYWSVTLDSVQVSTPDPAVDLLANGWLLYQTLASRYLGRSGYYQSGGAFGFRDQLQDTMALVHAQPELSRAHLLLSAAHQFIQGDVLHWWHPPQGRGVRTRCSDDYLWLPVAVCRYVELSGDHAVLDEQVPLIDGRPLAGEEESYYDLPHSTGATDSLYAHCVLALRRGCEANGERGLPLIGSGDWNDGLNRVGIGGRGESVWLGFFLFEALRRFTSLAIARGDTDFAGYCTVNSQRLRDNLQQHGWDGEWYRRAWFDDGTPLGSSSNDECRIDSIAQSWSVLSGAGDGERSRQAMDSLHRHLVKPQAGVVQLLDPPFDHTLHDPGYIRGYVPGVRENGGQYTHAAVWAAMAFAELGDSRRAWELTDLINPIHHALDAAAVERYKVEPYVLAADVYAVAPHQGRGGWTWYTGSAGWMYRLLTESLLGLHREGEWLSLRPCIPASWDSYRMRYRYGGSVYMIEVSQLDVAPARLELDGVALPELRCPLRDDGQQHRLVLHLPRPTT